MDAITPNPNIKSKYFNKSKIKSTFIEDNYNDSIFLINRKYYFLPPLIIQTIVSTIGKLIFPIIFKYEVEGIEKIEKHSGNLIFASNHLSELDPIIITVSLKYISKQLPLFFVSKESQFYKNFGWKKYFYGGAFFKLCGAYAVNSGHKDYAISLINHIKILNDSYSMCIFPEGKRSKDGTIGSAKGGLAYLAYKSNKPVVPVAIQGFVNLKLKDFLFKRPTLKIKFGEIMYINQLFKNIKDENAYKTVSNIVMENISVLLGKKIK